MNPTKFKKAASISSGLLVAFFAQKWFEQAYSMPTDVKKWIMIVACLAVLTAIIYFNVDEKGNF